MGYCQLMHGLVEKVSVWAAEDETRYLPMRQHLCVGKSWTPALGIDIMGRRLSRYRVSEFPGQESCLCESPIRDCATERLSFVC